MKKLSESSVELLAAQYVLGVLQGPARRRFERLMLDQWPVRQEVWFWESRLQPLAERVPPVPPPPAAWSRLSQRLWPEAPAEARGWGRWLWQGWSLVATLSAIMLAVMLGVRTAPVPQEQWLAVVQSAQAEPLWLVDANVNETQLRLKPIAAPALDTQKDFELWLLPRQGAPQSIGILPTGEIEVTLRLSAEQFQALLKNQSLAISLEPKGGSPTGQPTGPVVYQSKLLKL